MHALKKKILKNNLLMENQQEFSLLHKMGEKKIQKECVTRGLEKGT